MNSKIHIAIFLISVVLGTNSCSLLDPAADLNTSQQTQNGVIIKSIDLNIQKTSSTTDWTYCEIEEIDINSFFNVDSIIFIPNLRSQLSTEHCIAELYNFNNNTPILNSRVESFVRYTLHLVKSNNIKQTFPNDKFLIGVRFKSSKEGHYVEVGVGSRVLIYTH